MKSWIGSSAWFVLVACASSGGENVPGPLDPEFDQYALVEDTRAYIEAAGLETVTAVRANGPIRFGAANYRFVVMHLNRRQYLVETEHDCPELSGRMYNDTIDYRVRRNLLRAGYDTVRGCRIKTIYVMPKPDVETTEVDDGQTPSGR